MSFCCTFLVELLTYCHITLLSKYLPGFYTHTGLTLYFMHAVTTVYPSLKAGTCPSDVHADYSSDRRSRVFWDEPHFSDADTVHRTHEPGLYTN